MFSSDSAPSRFPLACTSTNIRPTPPRALSHSPNPSRLPSRISDVGAGSIFPLRLPILTPAPFLSDPYFHPTRERRSDSVLEERFGKGLGELGEADPAQGHSAGSCRAALPPADPSDLTVRRAESVRRTPCPCYPAKETSLLLARPQYPDVQVGGGLSPLPATTRHKTKTNHANPLPGRAGLGRTAPAGVQTGPAPRGSRLASAPGRAGGPAGGPALPGA